MHLMLMLSFLIVKSSIIVFYLGMEQYMLITLKEMWLTLNTLVPHIGVMFYFFKIRRFV